MHLEYDVHCCFVSPFVWALGCTGGVEPQVYADNLKCVSWDPGVLLRVAWFTTGHVMLVGQEPAVSKCVLMSTSKSVRNDMRGRIVTDEGVKWSVKLVVVGVGRLLWLRGSGWSLPGWS